MSNDNSRILIAGSYGHGNTGDEAILSAIIGQLRMRLPDSHLSVVAGDIQSVRERLGVETISWDDWAGIAQAVEQSDMVIQGGGGLFFDYTDFHPWQLFENGAPDLAHYAGFSLLAWLYARRFMIYAVGVGPLSKESEREVVRIVHSLAHAITVRDAESKALLEDIGMQADRIEVTADPAFSLQVAGEHRARAILTEHRINPEKPLIAVAPRPWDYGASQMDWANSLAEKIGAFAAEKGAQVLLIPFQKDYDDAPIQRIREKLSGVDVYTLRSHYLPEEIAAVIGACDLIVGLRLHSILFSILTATPAIALSYDPKVRSLTRLAGHEEICLDLSDLSHLEGVLADVWERRTEIAQSFDQIRSRMKELSERNADLACELLTSQVPELPCDAKCREILSQAFYGRLQAVRVRDSLIAGLRKEGEKEASRLKQILDTMNSDQSPFDVLPPAPPDDLYIRELRRFLRRVATSPVDCVVVMFAKISLRLRAEDAASELAATFADGGVPVMWVFKEANQDRSAESSENIYQVPLSAMDLNWDELLRLPVSNNCVRLLILRSVDRSLFRLVNHAHAMGWATVYQPDSDSPGGNEAPGLDQNDQEIERYVVNNVEHVIASNESESRRMQAMGARRVLTISERKTAADQRTDILNLVTGSLPQSPVRLAIITRGRA